MRHKFDLSSPQDGDAALVFSLGRCYKVYNNMMMMMMMMITIVLTIRQPHWSRSRAMVMAISNTSWGKLLESELKQLSISIPYLSRSILTQSIAIYI